MRKPVILLVVVVLLSAALLLPATPTMGQVGEGALSYCSEFAFSTEEDFVTQGPEPPDGDPIISDGDLLGPNCEVCARNAELLQQFDVTAPLGLDAVDVLDTEQYLVAFSTELDSSNRGQFTAGDLLVTNGAIIPNVALLYKSGAGPGDLGLDAIHFVGNLDSITGFVGFASQTSRAEWVQNPGLLATELTRYGVDIWFSTEGTPPTPENPPFLDGDFLSARYGTIVVANSSLLPLAVPAGIPSRGVDFGLDAGTCDRQGTSQTIRFSTEILYGGELNFTDGDVLQKGNGVEYTNAGLVACFEPKAQFLGLDALFMDIQPPRQGASFESPAVHDGAGSLGDESTYTYDPAPAAGTWVATGGYDRPSLPVYSSNETYVANLWAGAAPPMEACKDLAFSTEEDFVTQGPEPPDGNPIISDGDLLGPNCVVCARNARLLLQFDVTSDLGLDAVDVIDTESELVAFSTELDSPNQGQFTAGDLLVTNGAIIPNIALAYPFGSQYNIGLDAVHFVGPTEDIIAFLAAVEKLPPSHWVQNPGGFAEMLNEYGIDIWFSAEGTGQSATNPGFLDGDLLSAANGTIVASNAALLPVGIPAGIPSRGVDFGLDAVGADRGGGLQTIQFSTEILYQARPGFTDGDLLRFGNGVVRTNLELLLPCEPMANFLGLDAIYVAATEEPPTPTPTASPTSTPWPERTDTPTITPWPERTDTPTPTMTPWPERTDTPTMTPWPERTDTPTMTPWPDRTDTPTPTGEPPVDFPPHDKDYAEEEIEIYPYPVQPGVGTKLCVTIINSSGQPRTVTVEFGMANFGIGLSYTTIPAAGNPQQVTVPPNGSAKACIVWMPTIADAGHRCIQVTIRQPGFRDLTSRRNLDVLQPLLRPGETDTLTIPVRNPLANTVDIEMRVFNHCPGWTVQAVPHLLAGMAPGEIRSVVLHVMPPSGAILGSMCWIDVEAWALVQPEPILVGGIRKIDFPPLEPRHPEDPSFAQREIEVKPYPVEVGKRTEVCAVLENPGGAPITVDVEFSLADFGIGVPYTPIPHPDNPQTVTIPAFGSHRVCISFVPMHPGHICIQIRISKEGYEDVFSWKNLDVVEPLWPGETDTLQFPIGNPLDHAVDIEIEIDSECPGWVVTAEPALLPNVMPGEIRMVNLHVTPQQGTILGTECTVDVTAWAGNQMIGGIRKIDRPPVPHPDEGRPYDEREIEVRPFPLETGVLTEICAVLDNKSDRPQTVTVEFAMADFTIGAPFQPIPVPNNPRTVTLPPHSTVKACIKWVPLTPGHKCFQITISQAGYEDIISYKNLDVGEDLRPGVEDELLITVGNPKDFTADIQMAVYTTCADWQAWTEPEILEDVPPQGTRTVTLHVIPPAAGDLLGSGCYVDVESYINGELISGIRKMDLPPVHPPVGEPSYAEREITINPDPPVIGQPAQICATLTNYTGVDQVVDLTLYAADFGMGIPFHEVERIPNIPMGPHETIHKCVTWTPPPGSPHRCLQIRIEQEGYAAIVSQANFKTVPLTDTVTLPMTHHFAVGNPHNEPKQVRLDTKDIGLPDCWHVGLGFNEVTLGPGEVVSNTLTITGTCGVTMLMSEEALPGDAHSVAVEAYIDDELVGGVQFEFEMAEFKIYLPMVMKLWP